jgi:hypothetical protein
MKTEDIKNNAVELARASWQKHQNSSRQPEPEALLSSDELDVFTSAWKAAMNELKAAHDAFIAYEHTMSEGQRIQNPRFEESVVLEVLGEVRSKLGALGQSTKLFRDPSECSWEERKPPTKVVGDNHEAYEIAREIRARVVEAVDRVYRPESLTLTVSPIVRVEEPREEPFTAVLVTAESPITRTVTLAVYAERL